MKRFKKAIAMLLTLWMLVVYCGSFLSEAAGAETKTETPTVTLLASTSKVAVGKTIKIKVQTRGFSKTPSLKWSSGDKNVATVSNDGTVTGVSVGKATIKVVAKQGTNKASASIKIDVVNNVTPSVKLSAENKTVTVGKSIRLTAQVKGFSKAPEISWSSGNKNIAKVDSKGVVTGVSAGKATIKVVAKLGKVKASDSIEITVVQEVKPAVSLSADNIELTIGKKIHMTAQTENFSSSPVLSWSSSDEKVASVDSNGVVTGVGAGRATITVTARADNKTAESNMVIFVIKLQTPLKRFLTKFQVLSYKYHPVDDYYYTNDHKCWQSNFGFGRFYDFVAPYILLEYDYVRVFFTYNNKDYMVQLWKGQYGLIFYGCEQGVYYKEHSDKPDDAFTFYKCLGKDEWPMMSMTLYHDKQRNGNYVREFTRDNETHWWCTGFKPGHLRVEEPANELRQVGTITFRDAEMAKLFADGLAICGFTEARDVASIGLDQYKRTDATVSFIWQNINHAETTMPIKIAGGTAIAVGLIGLILGLLALFALMGMGAFVFFIIL